MTKNNNIESASASTAGRRTVLKSLALFALTAVIPMSPLTARANTGQQKILIAWFSHTGNSKAVADTIHAAVGGDMLEIKNRQPYPEEHSITEPRARREWEENARPELATVFPSDMDSYDIIFVGYPCWFKTAPMPMFTFLEQFKFAGKTIVPFTTHGGNGLANGPRDIARSCPQATVLEGLALRSREAANAQGAVNKWLRNNAPLAQLLNK